MSPTKRRYRKAPCTACNPSKNVSEQHHEGDMPLSKSHLNGPKHKFITSVDKDRIDSSIIRPQNNSKVSDHYYVQREEYYRVSKLNGMKTFFDYRFYERNKEYAYYCTYCDEFILGLTVDKHETLDSHWEIYRNHFKSDLENLLSKASKGCDTELEIPVSEFIRKYCGSTVKSLNESLDQILKKEIGTGELDDSGIEISNATDTCESTTSTNSSSMVTSTPIKLEKKTSPPKNLREQVFYVKDFHKSPGIYKVTGKGNIRMYYQNVRSVLSDEKMKNFIATTVCDYDMVIFTETWLKEGKTFKHNMNVFNEQFDVYRHDRFEKSNKSRGGGVLIAVSAKFYSDPVFLDDFHHLEYVCVQFLNNNKSVFLYCAYIPPNSALEIYEDHIRAIQTIKLGGSDILIVIGDFNLPKFVWHTEDNVTFIPEANEAVRETREQSDKLSMLKEFHSKCGLHQFCNAKNDKGNVLDLVFSNCKNISVAELPESQVPMTKPDPSHAPPFEIRFID